MYGKIFEEIFDSTIIQHGKEVVYVFMSMIVLSDKHGFLRFSIPALANRILMDPQSVHLAIDTLLKPDSESNNKDHDGRRIVPITEVTDGIENRGWFIVNKEFYKEKGSKYEKKEKTNDRVKRFRLRNADVTQCNDLVTQNLRHTDTDTDTDTDKSILAQKSTKVDPFEESFIRFWNAYPRKMAKQAASKAWSKIEATEVDLLLERLEAFKQSHEWTKDDGNFIPYPATWLNGRRWEDEIKNANGRPPAPTDPNDPYYTKDWSEDL